VIAVEYPRDVLTTVDHQSLDQIEDGGELLHVASQLQRTQVPEGGAGVQIAQTSSLALGSSFSSRTSSQVSAKDGHAVNRSAGPSAAPMGVRVESTTMNTLEQPS
jgi:hypothetical protein